MTTANTHIMHVEFDLVFSDFSNFVSDDPRIGPTHISLFVAILHFYKQQGLKSPISVFGRDLMKQAKISTGTYHRCIQELQSYGFIKYIPSFNPLLGSVIYVL